MINYLGLVVNWMKRTRRRTSFVFLLTLLVLLQAACVQILPRRTPTPVPTGSQPRATVTADLPPTAAPLAGPSATPTSAPLGLQAEDLRGVTVEFWHPWAGLEGPTVQALVDDFNRQNTWGIKVMPVAFHGLDDLGAAVDRTLASGGQMPDLLAANLHQVLAWDQQRPFLNLRPYLDDPLWGLSAEAQKDFYPVFWEQDVISGQRLGLPVMRSGQMLFYNRTWASELGFDAPPADSEGFINQACTAANYYRQDGQVENDGQGGWLVSTNYAAMLGWLAAFGGAVLKSPDAGAGDNPYAFNTPENFEAFQFLRGLYDTGCAWQAASEPPEAEFAARQGLFAAGSVMDIPYQAAAFRRLGSGDEWTVLPLPSPAGKPAISVYGPSLFMSPSAPPEQLAAWAFARWLVDPQNHARLAAANGSFPLRTAELAYLERYRQDTPQWAAAVDLLPLAVSEPALHSWGEVRWALQDAATQLFRSYFSAENLPATMLYLDTFAAELHFGSDLNQVFATTTNTPPPTRRPTWTPTPSATPRVRITATP